jgi:hypothetical protein
MEWRWFKNRATDQLDEFVEEIVKAANLADESVRAELEQVVGEKLGSLEELKEKIKARVLVPAFNGGHRELLYNDLDYCLCRLILSGAGLRTPEDLGDLLQAARTGQVSGYLEQRGDKWQIVAKIVKYDENGRRVSEKPKPRRTSKEPCRSLAALRALEILARERREYFAST